MKRSYPTPPHEADSRRQPAARAVYERVRALHPARRSQHRRQSGSVTVEFALILPLLVLLIVMVIDFGRAYNYWIDTTHLASEGARLAAVGKAPGGDLADYIKQQANTAELRDGGSDSVPGALVVCLTYPDPDGGSTDNPTPRTGDPVKVSVSSEYNWIPLVGDEFDLSGAKISSSSTHRLETNDPLEDGCTEA